MDSGFHRNDVRALIPTLSPAAAHSCALNPLAPTHGGNLIWGTPPKSPGRRGISCTFLLRAHRHIHMGTDVHVGAPLAAPLYRADTQVCLYETFM